jgi:DNA-binding NarL/FixJ family response regulator
MIRVILAASSSAEREQLRTLTQRAQGDAAPGRRNTLDVDVTNEASDAVRAHRLALHADVLVVYGASLLSQIAAHLDHDQLAPDLPLYAIVVITNDRRETATLESLPVRGWSIVTEDVSRDELMAAIAAADAGLGAMPVEWTARPRAIARARAIDWAPGDDAVADEHLTAREQEVLEWLSEGLSNRRIAERLGISEHTVKFHITAIYGKLGASTRTEAVNRALRRGWLRL